MMSPMSGGVALDDRYRYLSLTTYRANGAEVATPVWFASGDGTFYVFTAGDSGKGKRLRRSPRGGIAPRGARGKPHRAPPGAPARPLPPPAGGAAARAAAP